MVCPGKHHVVFPLNTPPRRLNLPALTCIAVLRKVTQKQLLVHENLRTTPLHETWLEYLSVTKLVDIHVLWRLATLYQDPGM